MRGLANYAMSGRYRALLIAVASSGSLLFGWIGCAVVALVTLRRGFREGAWLLLWALLPAVVLTRLTGDSSFLALLLGTSVLAATLRLTVSLPLTALCTTAVAVLTGLGLLTFGEPLLAELARVFEEFFTELAKQSQQRDPATAIVLQPPTQLQLAGMMGTAIGTLSFLCLVLARYWQAALYNPGGFGQEWRALRFPPTLVFALLVAAIALASAGMSFRSWAAALMLPLTIGGFALLHAQARERGSSTTWLTALYVVWLLLDVAKLVLVGLVAADALLDFRARWRRKAGLASADVSEEEAKGPEQRGPDGDAEGEPQERLRERTRENAQEQAREPSQEQEDERRTDDDDDSGNKA